MYKYLNKQGFILIDAIMSIVLIIIIIGVFSNFIYTYISYKESINKKENAVILAQENLEIFKANKIEIGSIRKVEIRNNTQYQINSLIENKKINLVNVYYMTISISWSEKTQQREIRMTSSKIIND